ncbi:peroxisomal biogenesis factor 11 [Gorgonomyces haynaldii]|nr:peroxisomal biogenesis factor 11 [Gorgonomyces haynaldii]
MVKVDLDKLCRFLNSVRGTDKALMLVQYSSKIIIWHLQRLNKDSKLAVKVGNFSGPVSDFRILLRYYGLLPLVQWILYTEKNPSPNPLMQTIIRLQNVSNLIYYPLEHTYWLALHKVIDLSDETRDKIGMWSCRFWALYVVLYFYQLYEEYKDLKRKELKKLDDKQIKQLKDEKENLVVNTVINAAYFPLTVHWSLEKSSFPDIGVGIFGTIASVFQIYAAWKST